MPKPQKKSWKKNLGSADAPHTNLDFLVFFVFPFAVQAAQGAAAASQGGRSQVISTGNPYNLAVIWSCMFDSVWSVFFFEFPEKGFFKIFFVCVVVCFLQMNFDKKSLRFSYHIILHGWSSLELFFLNSSIWGFFCDFFCWRSYCNTWDES